MFEFPKVKPDTPQDYTRGEPSGFCCGESRKMLQELIESIKPTVICEIGSFKGMSAHFIAKHSTAEIYCIDHWKGSPEHPRMGIDCSNLYEIFIVNMWEFRDRIHPIINDSIKGLVELEEAGILPQIIYVDGAHDKQSVCLDIKVAKICFPNAVICGDDWTLPGVRDGVHAATCVLDMVARTYNERCWRLEDA